MEHSNITTANSSQIAAPASLPSNTVLNFFEDNEKNFWIGTQAGMVRLTRAQVSIVPLPKANDSDFGTIYKDRDGSFWIGSTLLFQMKMASSIRKRCRGSMASMCATSIATARARCGWEPMEMAFFGLRQAARRI